jgi:hypothetical protein
VSQADSESTMMITEIGITAGEIWRLLDEKGPLEVEEMARQVPGSEVLVFMALGWLCREGHVIISQGGGRLLVELKSRLKEGNQNA